MRLHADAIADSWLVGCRREDGPGAGRRHTGGVTWVGFKERVLGPAYWLRALASVAPALLAPGVFTVVAKHGNAVVAPSLSQSKEGTQGKAASQPDVQPVTANPPVALTLLFLRDFPRLSSSPTNPSPSPSSLPFAPFASLVRS